MKPVLALFGGGRRLGAVVAVGALVSLVVASCRRSPPARPAPAAPTVAPSVVVPVTVTAPCAAPAAEPAPPAPPVLAPPDVPTFDPAQPTSPAAAAQVDEAMQALAYDPSSDDTLERLVAAVTAAPGAARARYGLACALNRRRAEVAASAQLEQLFVEGCPACADARANLATDLGCSWTDDQRRLAAVPSPQRRAVRLLADAIIGHDASLAAAHFRRPVAYRSACSVCDDPAGDVARTIPGGRLLAGLVGRQKHADDGGEGWVNVGTRMWCDGTCCTIDVGYLSHSASFVTSVCFAPGTTDVVSFTEIDGG
ncbi:MAG TPA: hypothetical protein VM734_36000 [Kofleriaceae bacterium]|nr:hypothetical protein [Kofleriaceae bacterium]